jgi:hypothetical protein
MSRNLDSEPARAPDLITNQPRQNEAAGSAIWLNWGVRVRLREGCLAAKGTKKQQKQDRPTSHGLITGQRQPA